MDIIKGYISEIMGRFVFPKVDVTDAIEILVLAVIIYHIAIWIRNTRAWMLLKGIALLGLVALVAAIFQLNVILWLFEKTIGVGVTLLVVVFQPELRHALEQLGQKKIINTFNFFDDPKDKMERFSDKTIDCIIKAMEIQSHELYNYEVDGLEYILKIKTDLTSLLEIEKIDELYKEGYKQTKRNMGKIKSYLYNK